MRYSISFLVNKSVPHASVYYVCVTNWYQPACFSSCVTFLPSFLMNANNDMWLEINPVVCFLWFSFQVKTLKSEIYKA